MRLSKIKYVRGRCMYKFRNTLYFEQPPKTRISKLLYDANDNITYAMCRKVGIKTEILCGIIIVICVALSLFYQNTGKELLYYQGNILYHDSTMYLNIENSEISLYPMTCYLEYDSHTVATKFLEPGYKWLTEEIEYSGQHVTLYVEYNYPYFTRHDRFDINVTIKE